MVVELEVWVAAMAPVSGSKFGTLSLDYEHTDVSGARSREL